MKHVDIEEARKQLRMAIELHEKHMKGTAPTTGPAGMRSQQEMMEMMKRAMAALESNGYKSALHRLMMRGMP